VDHGIFRIARREQDPQLRMPRAGVVRQLGGAHRAGHDDIGKQHVDLRGLGQRCHGVVCAAGSQDAITEIAQDGGDVALRYNRFIAGSIVRCLSPCGGFI
jgi:hypothetical protein